MSIITLRSWTKLIKTFKFLIQNLYYKTLINIFNL